MMIEADCFSILSGPLMGLQIQSTLMSKGEGIPVAEKEGTENILEAGKLKDPCSEQFVVSIIESPVKNVCNPVWKMNVVT
ncbi:hypothetical protein MLD38_039768 [Melastoma candidum]|uniref:Uncharacterized protein n=1 Tax=Melastoma candidum TaxID=119954 RepID=A0ACB9L3W7_9MYRT|nr:hypothetical protein MLD38_039768 [Melastoma candidum]